MKPYIDAYDSVTEKHQPFHSTMHSHDHYEIYCFLSGDAQYCVEGRRYTLTPGDVVLLTKGEVHRAELRSLERYCRIGVHFNLHDLPEQLDLTHLLSPFHDRPIGKFNHYPARLFAKDSWIYYLRQIAHAKDDSAALCYLLPLLCELADAFPTLQKSELFAQKDLAAPIMKYINRNLTEELTLEALSQEFHISQTHLNRLFRQSVGTTVWQYITVKRLFAAREKLAQGMPPTKVCTVCGFQEYSTFYRAYKQHFGVPPSAHKNT